MSKRSARRAESPQQKPEPKERVPGGNAIAAGLWWLAAATLALSVAGMVVPEQRLWAVHQFAFLKLIVAIPILLVAGLLLTPAGVRLSDRLFARIPKFPAIGWAGAAFAIFMLFSVYGSLLGDGQLSITRLAHVGDMLESGKPIPRGRFLSQKEPGTMILHEGAFRVAMKIAGPDMHVAPGIGGQQARVERQLIYRGLAQWCYRILSALAGALLVLLLLRFIRTREDVDATLFWVVMLSSGAWLTFFGYVENYAWVTLCILSFLIAGLKVAEPPRKLPILLIALFALACAMHFMAITLLPALIFLLWTLHFEPRDRERSDSAAPLRRGKLLIAVFVALGSAGYVFVKGWKGWVSVIPLLPQWVKDGYALLSWKHGADLLNLLLWAGSAALLVLLLTKRIGQEVRARNQEMFLLIAAGASAFFAGVFSPNLGMARDWDIVTTALWPLLFWGAFRLSRLDFSEAQRANMRARCLALTILILVPAVLVQTSEASTIERFKTLLKLDRSRSAYGWENLALYYQRTGELQKRIEAWREAVAVERNPRYLFNLAEALRLNEQISEADTLAITAASLKTDFVPNLFFYAAAQAKAGRYDRAKVLVDTALALKPDVQYGKGMQTWVNRLVFADSIAASGDTMLALEYVSEFMRADTSNTFWLEYIQRLKN